LSPGGRPVQQTELIAAIMMRTDAPRTPRRNSHHHLLTISSWQAAAAAQDKKFLGMMILKSHSCY